MPVRSHAIALCSVLAVFALPAAGLAQAARFSAPTPLECTKAIAAWRSKETAPAYEAYLKATPDTKADLQKKYSAALAAAGQGAERRAAECASAFDPATIDPAQLNDLNNLYTSARDTVNARRASDRLLLSVESLPPAVAIQALMVGVSREYARSNAVKYFGIIDSAEALVTRIDQIAARNPGRPIDSLTMLAHRTMLGYYGYLDVADGLENHSRKVIALATKLGKRADMIYGYGELARSYADRLHPDSALQLLAAAERIIPRDTGRVLNGVRTPPDTTRLFDDFRTRYALIGKPATAITAEWWINTDAPAVVAPAKGKVTLIEFTAHWCGPCKNSYPGLVGLAEKYRGKDFQGVMVTSLYGYIGTEKNLTPEQEVAADRAYFGKEHALPFPVAINATPKTPLPGQSYARPKPDVDYEVGGIPQIIIVDRNGIIRQIVTGWDRGNTERFGKLIDALLREPVM